MILEAKGRVAECVSDGSCFDRVPGLVVRVVVVVHVDGGVRVGVIVEEMEDYAPKGFGRAQVWVSIRFVADSFPLHSVLLVREL